MNSKPTVLVVCTGNSMRSQIAEGLLRHDLGEVIDVFSAGTHPGTVHAYSISTLEEIGIDIRSHRSKHINEFLDRDIDLVITVCDSAHEACPVLPRARKTVHRGYPDPVWARPNADFAKLFAQLRDRMRVELRQLVVKELALKQD